MRKFSSSWAVNHDLFPAEKVSPFIPCTETFFLQVNVEERNKYQPNLNFFLLFKCLNHFLYLPDGLDPGNGGKEGRKESF